MENRLFGLDRLPPFCAAEVVRVKDSEIAGRLSAMGITAGAKLVRLFSAPCGDPTAYGVRGTVVALRKKDASGIIIRSDGTWE